MSARGNLAKTVVCCTAAALLLGCQKSKVESQSFAGIPAGSQTQASPPPKTEGPVQKKTTVCVWDGVPVREAPNKSGKYLSSISLGETVEFLGDTKTDAGDKNREYLKVRLSDGKEGWASSYGMIQNATVGVINEDALVYKRPDVLTMTNDKLPAMSIVAVTQEKDDWAMITGESKKKSGWIKKTLVSGSAEDVADAIFASRKLKQDDKMTYAEKVNYIATNAPFPSSPVIEKLKQAAAAGQPASAAAAAPADSAAPAKAPGADSAAAAPAAK